MRAEQIKTYRYPGVKPFSENERHLFYGRSTDIKKLSQLITLEKLVLLYSKSGLGKSSLLNAGVLPLFDEAEGYTNIKIRLGAHFDQSLSPITTTLFKLPEAPSNVVLDKLGAGNDTLWLRMKGLQHKEADVRRTFILVFDQFEELFTYSQEDIKQFKRQLADLLYAKVPGYISKSITNRLRENPEFLSKEELEYLYLQPVVKVVLSIRSDRMSLLNTLADYLPDIQKNYYELKPFDRDSAIESIVKPALDKTDIYLSPSFGYSTDCINSILNYLAQGGQKSIETFQLQTVCQFTEKLAMENQLPFDEKKQMLLAEPGKLGDLQSIFRTQYDKLMGNIEPIEKQLAARLLIENKLIIDGNRISLPDVVVLKEKGIDKELIAYLHDTHHILRCEPNTTGGISYELSHDTLVAPILKAKKEREAKEELTRLESESQEEVKRQRLRIKKIRSRVILAGFIVLLVVALISIYAYTKNVEAARLKHIEFAQKLLIISNAAENSGEYKDATLISRTAYLLYKKNKGNDFRNFYMAMLNKLWLSNREIKLQDFDSSFVFPVADKSSIKSIAFTNGNVYAGYENGKILKTKWADSIVMSETFFDFKKYISDTTIDPEITNISISKDKNYMAVGGWFPYIRLFDLRKNADESGTLQTPAVSNQQKIIQFTDDGNLLMLSDSALTGWNKNNDYQPINWKGKKQFNYEGGKYISVNAIPKDRQVHWNTGSLSLPGVKFNCMTVFKEMIAIGIDSGLVLIKKDSLIKINLPGIGIPFSIQPDLNGNYLYIGNVNGEISKMKLTDYGIEINQNQTQTISKIICSNDGNFIASSSFDGSIGVYNINNEENWKYTTPLNLIIPKSCIDQLPIIPWSIAFSEDNKYLLAGYDGGIIYKWPVSADVLADLICNRISLNWDSVGSKYIDKEIFPIELNGLACKSLNRR